LTAGRWAGRIGVEPSDPAAAEGAMGDRRVEEVLSDNERLRQANDALRSRIERHSMGPAVAEPGARAEPAAEYFGWIRRYVEVALEASSAALALFTEEGRLLATNAKLLALFPDIAPRFNAGARFDEVVRLISRSSALDLDDDAARDFWAQARTAARSAATQPAVAPLRNDRWVEISERRTAQGAFALAFEDVTDSVITRRRGRHARAIGGEAVMRAVLENLPLGVCAFDHENRLMAWNDALRGMLGLGLSELREDATLDEVSAMVERAGLIDTAQCARKISLWAHATPPRMRLTLEIERRDGAIFAVEGRESADGGYVLSFNDVTAERRAVNEISQVKETLERRVFERTSALVEVNDKLVQEIAERRAIEAEMRRARDGAEAANLSKTRFIAAASHDLLQPLNAAKLFVSSLTEGDLPEPAREVARRVGSAFESVEALLGALLDISKLDTGRGETAVTDFPIARILGPVAEEFGTVAASRGLKLKVAPSRAVVRSDPHYLRRIVQNLVSNALKYTESGGVVVGARRRGDALLIEVWDSGVGIPSDERRRIFEEFHRIDSANPRGERGMGLGLAIVERACRLLGHSVDIRSAEGEGSVFTVTVPLGDPAAAAEHGAAAARLDVAETGAGVIALLVEDDSEVRAAMSALLEKWGVDLLEASSAEEALELIDSVGMAPDVVMVDYHLAHGATGLEALERIRAAAGVRVPAILITADRTRAVAREAEAAGAQLLSKPVAPAKLRALLQWSQLDHPDAPPPGG
jgi:signal transduction histidine kinase/ActR/RegA family two-component response regulator